MKPKQPIELADYEKWLTVIKYAFFGALGIVAATGLILIVYFIVTR